MRWIDLLRISSSNLKRRKLRTFLTVLGVIIGTASIVVMISLGMGMQRSLYKEVEESGGLTSIKVRGSNAGEVMYGGRTEGDGGSSKKEEKYIDGRLLKHLSEIQHVEKVSPVYQMNILLLKGIYEGTADLIAMKPEELKEMNIKLASGSLPKPGISLEFLYGNGIPTLFYEKATNKGYYDTRRLPDINFARDSMFVIFDPENYHSGNNVLDSMVTTDKNKTGNAAETAPQKSSSKYVVRPSGVIAGGIEKYNMHYGSVYCDLDSLQRILKKEFAGRVIPGQPKTKSGKPYKEFVYTYAQVHVDEIEHVDAIASQIRDMGYEVETNAEYLDAMKSQFAIVQAVLGGIGAVSLLVAAIGIANTMMMSIYERTKEIGVIKVLGCSLKNIKQMFLLEAAFIGLLGGLLGNAFSFLISGTINFLVSGEQIGLDSSISYIPWWMVPVSMGFAMLVGILAGYFPAKRAMQLSPLEAIRNN